MNCPFCDFDVIKKQVLYENKNIYVIHNIRPSNKGQCLVLPKSHVCNIRDLNKEELVDLILTVQLISKKYKEYLNPIAFNYGFNEGYYAGQMVEHFHFHIMLRLEDDKDKLPEYHLFHRDPKFKKDLSSQEMDTIVLELGNLFC